MDKKKKKFRIFFSTFRKITVGGFVNQLIKKFWPKQDTFDIFIAYSTASTKENLTIQKNC